MNNKSLVFNPQAVRDYNISENSSVRHILGFRYTDPVHQIPTDYRKSIQNENLNDGRTYQIDVRDLIGGEFISVEMDINLDAAEESDQETETVTEKILGRVSNITVGPWIESDSGVGNSREFYMIIEPFDLSKSLMLVAGIEEEILKLNTYQTILVNKNRNTPKISISESEWTSKDQSELYSHTDNHESFKDYGFTEYNHIADVQSVKVQHIHAICDSVIAETFNREEDLLAYAI